MSDADCNHRWRWVRDWYGDPQVVNGTRDCSHWQCAKCDKVADDGDSPEEAPDERNER